VTKRAWLLVSAWLATSGVHAAEPFAKSIAGSYEVLICKNSCDDDVLVKGRLILFPRDLTQQELARVDPSETSRRRVRQPNGCFELEKVKDSGYRGYAGIDKVGLTQWSIEKGALTFQLFRSPDAGYRVTVQPLASDFDGKGQSWGAGVAAPRERAPEKVVLRRKGAASLSACPVAQ
jgi:hypothetical protein